MIFFSVFSGEPNAVRACYLRTMEGLEANVPFVNGVRHHHISSDRRWGVVAYSSPDPIAETRYFLLPQGCVVINGPLLCFDGKVGDPAFKAIAEELAAGNIEDVYRKIDGTYAIGGYLQRHGLFGFGDFSGLTPLYTTHTNELSVVGNKPSLVGLANEKKQLDEKSLSWLIGHSNVFGVATPVKGVDLVEAETLVSAKIGYPYRKVSLPTVWPDREEEPLNNLSSSAWDEITHDLIKNTKAAVSFLPEAKVALTGGKDSRLILALTGASLPLDMIHSYTNGTVDNPDVECASFVAKEYGVKHTINDPSARSSTAFDPKSLWPILSAHSARFDGLICPWDGRAGNLKGTNLEFSGFGGELYRSHAKQFIATRPTEIKDAQARWRNYHQRFDPLGVLRDPFVRYQEAWTDNWVAEQKSHIVSLPEKFYVLYRLGHWSGPLMQNAVGRIKLAPLLSTTAAKHYLRLNHEARVSELLHYEVMRRLSPKLVKIPFLKQTWNEFVRRHDEDLPSEPYKTSMTFTPSSIAPQQMQFVKEQKTEIKEFLMEAKNNTDIDNIFDVDKVTASLDNEQLMSVVINVKTVLSAVGIAHTVRNMGVMPRDVPKS